MWKLDFSTESFMGGGQESVCELVKLPSRPQTRKFYLICILESDTQCTNITWFLQGRLSNCIILESFLFLMWPELATLCFPEFIWLFIHLTFIRALYVQNIVTVWHKMIPICGSCPEEAGEDFSWARDEDMYTDHYDVW